MLYPLGSPLFTAWDSNGQPLSGGKLYCYEAGTTTAKATYADASGASANTFPVVLNARGEARVYFAGAAKFVLKDAAGVDLWTADYVGAVAGEVTNMDGLRALGVPAGLVTINLLGYYAAGDGGGGPFYWDANSTATDNGGTVILPTGYTGTGRWVRNYSGAVNVRWFGAVYDDITDDYDAHRRAIDWCRTSGESTTIQLPEGKSFISKELEIDAQVIIQGSRGTLFDRRGGTTLRWPKNVNGIRITRSTTSASGGEGDDSILTDFDLYCGDKTATSGHGLVMDARAKCVNVSTEGFGGDGFHIEATATDTPAKNANLWSLERCRATNNARDGLFVDGADVNAGYAIGMNVVENGRNGIYDSSFLGNTYTAAHAAHNGKRHLVKGSDGQAYTCILDHVATADTIPITGANWATYWELYGSTTSWPEASIGLQYYANGGYDYKSDDANAVNCFIGCYTEGGGVRSNYLRYPAQVVGGRMTPVTPIDNTGPVFAGHRPLRAYSEIAGSATTVESWLGDTQSLSAFTFKSSDTGVVWRLTYDENNNVWHFSPNNSNSSRSFYLCDASNTVGLPTGVMDFSPNGFALMGKRHFAASAAPTTGTWAVGDIVFNTSPTAGGYLGWVCVRAGIAAPVWAASAAESVGNRVVPSADNGHAYECTTAGTTGSAEPAWPTAAGATVTDGTVVWTEKGSSALFKTAGPISA